MLVGFLIGMLAVYFDFSQLVKDWVSPFGEIFMRLLKMSALPLVFVSLIKGIGGLRDATKLATIGIQTVVIYTLTTVFAIALGVGLVLLIEPGSHVSRQTSEALTASYSDSLDAKIGAFSEVQKTTPLQGLIDLFPENAFQAMTDNGAMLQVILLAALIGCAAIMVGEKKSKALLDLIDSVDAVVLKMLDIIMLVAPLGVAALIVDLIVGTMGDVSLLSALGMYVLTVVIGLFVIMYGFDLLLVHFFTGLKVKDFIRAIIPVQLMGFTTSSSSATLVTTMKVATEDLKLPKRITSFTLPVGATINMDGTSCYQAIATIFIAQVMGIDLTATQILIIVGTTTLSSIGTPGIPGGSIVISMMVLSSVGIPPEGLALIIGLDRPLDMLRTSVNVTGDVAVSAILTKRNKD